MLVTTEYKKTSNVLDTVYSLHLPLAVAASKPDIYQMLYIQFELLMMGGKTT
jgi:hypothetical protein